MMDNIIDVAKYLNKSLTEANKIANYDSFNNSITVLKTVEEKLTNRVDRISNNLQGFDAKEFLKKIMKQFSITGNLDGLSRREINSLPFIVYKVKNEALLEVIIKKISNTNNSIIFYRETSLFFLNYEEGTLISESLRKDILKKLNSGKINNKKVKIYNENKYLFQKDGINQIVKKIMFNGSIKYFSSIDFTVQNGLLGSAYVDKIFKIVFSLPEEKFSISKKVILLKSMLSKYERVYINSVPYFIESLILHGNNLNLMPEDNIRKYICTIAVDYLGEPRISNHIGYKWHLVGKKSKNIMIRWLSLADFKLFFKIIGASISDFHKKEMWEYRNRFWSSYANNEQITLIWPFYGSVARDRIKQYKIENNNDYAGTGGEFIGSAGQKSCIMMCIGGYTIIERSYDGTVLAWKQDECPFGIEETINEKDITKYSGMFDNKNFFSLRHMGSEYYAWQNKMADQLANRCGAYKDPSSW